jgi:uncharacterized protein with ACT and thioredoxin-like domain
MGLERTFGARSPVIVLGPSARDMKRGPIAVPDHHGARSNRISRRTPASPNTWREARCKT